MAAGQGFKTFTTGEVLTAADVNGYLMQGVLVFASAAARDAAITSPQEGQFAYTKDNNSLWYYTGSAWAASGATGDIEGVTAGVGISGGGTSGTVTITNDMATTITAAGDLIVGTGSGTYDNLPIGTTSQVLTADTTVSPYKVKWAAGAIEPSWATWSPTVTGLTKGNGTEVARYRNNGKMVDIFYQFTLGSTSSITGQVYLTPPVNSIYDLSIACAYFYDAGVADVPAGIYMAKTVIYPKTMGTAGTYLNQAQLNATTPFTWGTGDMFNFNFSYEVA
jgi:hypothetical protein